MWLSAGRPGNLRAYVGLIAPARKGVGIVLLVAVPFCVLTWAMQALAPIPEFNALLAGPHSPLRPVAAATTTLGALCIVFLYAVLQTALSEEILFRGLIAKRLLARFSFMTANILQAGIFAGAHTALLLFAASGAGLAVHALFFLTPFAMALVSPIVNERFGGGSIAPSWILHAAVNLTSGLTFWALL